MIANSITMPTSVLTMVQGLLRTWVESLMASNMPMPEHKHSSFSTQHSLLQLGKKGSLLAGVSVELEKQHRP